MLHAATTQYALGCRTGHRGTVRLAAEDPALLQEWAAAHPLAGVPGIDLAAGAARRAGTLTPTAAVAEALDNGTAVRGPRHPRHALLRRPLARPGRIRLDRNPRARAARSARATDAHRLRRQASVDSEGKQPDPWTMT